MYSVDVCLYGGRCRQNTPAYHARCNTHLHASTFPRTTPIHGTCCTHALHATRTTRATPSPACHMPRTTAPPAILFSPRAAHFSTHTRLTRRAYAHTAHTRTHTLHTPRTHTPHHTHRRTHCHGTHTPTTPTPSTCPTTPLHLHRAFLPHVCTFTPHTYAFAHHCALPHLPHCGSNQPGRSAGFLQSNGIADHDCIFL